MAETLNISALVSKASDSRGPWGPLTFDVAESIEADLGARTVSIAPGGTLDVPFDGTVDADTLIIKTGKTVLLSATFAPADNANITSLQVRALILMTERLLSVTLTNPNTDAVLVTVCLTKRTT